MFYHDPIQIKNLNLILPHKICFENFSTQVHHGDRIAIIGRNGIGKSVMLKAIQNKFDLIEGEIITSDSVSIGYIPQTVDRFEDLSGGQRFNKALTETLSSNPNVLLLDEPTNHLDINNRKSLMRKLTNYRGTLLIASHDVKVLRCCVNKLWHIDNGKVKIFSGRYDDYLCEIKQRRQSLEQELRVLDHKNNSAHDALMKEQERAKKSQIRGRKKRSQGHWSTLVAGAKKQQAQTTTGKKKRELKEKKQDITDQLTVLRLPEVITPKFSLTSEQIGNKNILSIRDGNIAYDKIILQDLHLSLMSNERIAITGNNGSGKSTLVRGILCQPSITKAGEWQLPNHKAIGYLDQHYANLDHNATVYETISALVPSWSHAEVRKHLNDFLFRKNEEVNAVVSTLSGGEKARLSLAKIAAHTPQLLLLDEITNNIDLETRNHVIQVIKNFPGAIIIISHDEDFLEEIGVDNVYNIIEKRIVKEAQIQTPSSNNHFHKI
jgi:ATPase subunit of ABC transporter with duplicated ATPase domains